MSQHHTFSRLSASLAALSVLFTTACGGGGGDAPPTAAPSATSSPAPAASWPEVAPSPQDGVIAVIDPIQNGGPTPPEEAASSPTSEEDTGPLPSGFFDGTYTLNHQFEGLALKDQIVIDGRKLKGSASGSDSSFGCSFEGVYEGRLVATDSPDRWTFTGQLTVTYKGFADECTYDDGSAAGARTMVFGLARSRVERTPDASYQVVLDMPEYSDFPLTLPRGL